MFALVRKNILKNACDIVNISDGCGQRIFKYYANKALQEKESESLRLLLGIDDIASKKGHNYALVLH